MSTTRRQFLSAALAVSPALVAALKASPLVIIDTHTHFSDPSRPSGVPWPGKGDKVLFRQTLPANYRAQEVLQPVTGTVGASREGRKGTGEMRSANQAIGR